MFRFINEKSSHTFLNVTLISIHFIVLLVYFVILLVY